MRRVVLCGLISFCALLSTQGAETAGRAVLTFETKATGEGKYEPKHCLAVWVTDSEGNFVKTLQVNANKHKKHLKTWVAKTGQNQVDAVTSATLPQHRKEEITWDCRDANGNVVPDGDYQVHIEMTSKNMQGPLTPEKHIQFTKGKKAVSLQPADLKTFKAIKVDYTPMLKNKNL